MSERLGKLQKDILCFVKVFNFQIPSGDFIAQLFDTHRDSATRSLRKLTSVGYLVQCYATDVLEGMQGNSKGYQVSPLYYSLLFHEARQEAIEARDQLRVLKEDSNASASKIETVQTKLKNAVSRIEEAKHKRTAAEELWLDVTPKLEANWSDCSKSDLDQLKDKAMSVASSLQKTSTSA